MKFIKAIVAITFLGISFSTLKAQEEIPYVKLKEKGTYYVYAPSGLNFRKGPTVNAERITNIPYGAKVDIVTPSNSFDIKVDQLSGGMSKILYKGQEGYIFDGYLCSYPAPAPEVTVRNYVDFLRARSKSAIFENCERDYDGIYNIEETIIPRVNDWAEAFLIAQTLFDLSPNLQFPEVSNAEEEKFDNPKKGEYVWEDTLIIKRDKKGKPISMKWYYRTEGSGRTVSIMMDEFQNGLRINLSLTSD